MNASRPGSPQAHASLGSGWRPTLAGWEWIPTGFRTRFQRSHHGILSPLTGLSRHTRWCMVAALPPKGPLIHPPHAPRAAHNHDMKSRVHPKYKTKYHVRNWASYERALVHRGDVTVWLSPAAIAAWEPDGHGRRGWRKLHLGVNRSGVIVAQALTDATTDVAHQLSITPRRLAPGVPELPGTVVCWRRSIHAPRAS